MALQYKKPITISNAGGTQTNYAVMLAVNTQSLVSTGKLQADGDDLRFKTTDGDLLSHWVVPDTINTSVTHIYVCVPTIAASGDTIINMYYGDNTLTNIESFVNTFPSGKRLFYDDFDSGTPGENIDGGKWPYCSSTWVYVDDTASGGVGLGVKPSSVGRAIGDTSISVNHEIIAKHRISSPTYQGAIGGRFTSDTAASQGYGYRADASNNEYNHYLYYWYGGGGQGVQLAVAARTRVTTYQVHRMTFIGSDISYYYPGGMITANHSTYSSGRVQLYGLGANHIICDWVLARELVTNVTHALGAEDYVGPNIYSVSPTSGAVGVVKSLTIVGDDFEAGAAVELVKTGESDITATDVVVNPTEITCDVDLDGAALGWWDLTVTNP